MKKMDLLDWKIINCLSKNVRMPAAEISRAVGSSGRTVQNRIKKLTATGILKPQAIFSPEKFGYKIIVDVFLTIGIQEDKEAIEALLKMPEIVYVAYSSGEQDISIQAVFKDSDSLYNFVKNTIPQVPGVKTMRTVLTHKVLKSPCQWRPCLEDFTNIKNNPKLEK